MNLQQIFDTGVAGVLNQGGFAFSDDDNGCFYRGPNDTKCALGWSISDEDYNAFLEGQIPTYYDGEASLVAELLGVETGEDANILCDFQSCHDVAAREGEGLEGFKRRARKFAEKHNLDTKVLDQ